MKKPKVMLLLFFIVLCAGITYSASAANTLSVKQLLLDKLQSSDSSLKNELYETSSGTASYEIKALKGDLVSDTEPINALEGSKLKFDYKINSPAKKLEANYNLVFNKNTYEGNLFIDNNKLILSNDILSLIKAIDPEFNIGGEKEFPEYVFFSDEEITNLWETIGASKGQGIPPVSGKLLAFFVEAIPDKYFTFSLVDQKVSLSIDQNGLEDVLLSVMLKIKGEKERFATLMADFITTFDPTRDSEEIRQETIKALEENIDSGDFPDSPEKIRELLKGDVTLQELTYEASLLPSGQNRFYTAINLNRDSDFVGRVTGDVKFSESKENLNGTYIISLNVLNDKEDIKVDGQISGEFAKTAVKAKSKGLINISASSGASTLLDLSLQANSNANFNQDVRVDIPALTSSNSMNIESYIKDMTESSSSFSMKNGNALEIVVDGKPVAFDVDPFIIYSKDDMRIMAPVRNIAEAMGCEVTWVAPDQININRDDVSITMYIKKTSYLVNGVEKKMDTAPFIMNDKRTVVPVRFMPEELGYRVDYDETSNTVFINSRGL